MRYVVPRDARILASARVKEARQILFGHEQGLPGERWLARPLVSRDMLQWYFPSKYGLQEFRLSEYYQMQAERFAKRPTLPWVGRFSNLSAKMTNGENFEKIDKFLRNPPPQYPNHVVDDFRAMFELVRLGDVTTRLLQVASIQPTMGDSASGQEKAVAPSSITDKRHRFVDPLFRRRRLKWMERFLAGMNNSKEIKYNRHFTRHPDEQKKWPTNMGSVTVKWPNRRN